MPDYLGGGFVELLVGVLLFTTLWYVVSKKRKTGGGREVTMDPYHRRDSYRSYTDPEPIDWKH